MEKQRPFHSIETRGNLQFHTGSIAPVNKKIVKRRRTGKEGERESMRGTWHFPSH